MQKTSYTVIGLSFTVQSLTEFYPKFLYIYRNWTYTNTDIARQSSRSHLFGPKITIRNNRPFLSNSICRLKHFDLIVSHKISISCARNLIHENIFSELWFHVVRSIHRFSLPLYGIQLLQHDIACFLFSFVFKI